MKKSDGLSNWLELGIDIPNRTIDLRGEVDEEMAAIAVRGIHTLESLNKDPITVNLSTYGGGLYEGLEIYDALSNSECQILTICSGKIMSMGTIIMLAGDTRISSKNCTFMLHTVSSGAGGKLFEIETDAVETRRAYNILLDIYAERTKQPRSYFQKWLKYEDQYINPIKAKELGFIHEIV